MAYERLRWRTNYPKLGVLERTLDYLGVAHRHAGESAHAPILEVDALGLVYAEAVLNLPLERIRVRTEIIASCMLEAIGAEIEGLIARYGEACAFDDAPDNDAAFGCYDED